MHYFLQIILISLSFFIANWVSADYEKIEFDRLDRKHFLRIEKYKIKIPGSIERDINIQNLGVGSGLMYAGISDDNLIFYGLGDRGPLASMPLTEDKEVPLLFLYPNYIPSALKITVTPGKGAQVSKVIKLNYGGEYATALSLPDGLSTFYKKAINIDRNFSILERNHFGLDPEALDIDKQGFMWIAEEEWPSLMKVVSQNGFIVETYRPGKGLPEIFKYIQSNRGFESIAVVNKKVYALAESTLDIEGETKCKALFLRMVELDFETGKTRMLGYPLDAKKYRDLASVKVSDMVSYKDGYFLVIEQGTTKAEEFHRTLYAIDISTAEDLTDVFLSTSGKELEYADFEDLKNIQFIKKNPMCELSAYGWDMDKMEGLAIINDFRIAITNDNDFNSNEAYSSSKFNPSKMKNYVTDLNNKAIIDKETQLFLPSGSFPGSFKGEHNYLWILTLNDPLDALFNLYFGKDCSVKTE